jgi:pyrimidine operon attenuation protein/uracil phosphoribosyltransferase
MARPEGYTERVQLMDAGRIERALARIAAEIHERHPRPRDLVLVGIRSRGVPLARRIAAALAEEGAAPAVGALDITLYRDDLTAIAPQPILKGTDIPVPIDDQVVVLVDDVLFTGRTVRAALDELVDFGRPARIELAVLIDRGHRELPIRPDYVGKTVTTSREESVQVMLLDHDGEDRVALLEKSHP